MSNSLVRLTHGATCDILKARPIMLQVQEHGELNVTNYIKANLLKLSAAIGDHLENDQTRLEMIAEDLMELYYYDSIEDIRECLKKGRQGKYGFGHHKRGYITMLLLREWMTSYLDEKCSIREKQILAAKVEHKEIENFNPEEFYANGKKFFEQAEEREKKRNSFNSNAYDRIKDNYFEDKKDQT